MFMGHKISQNRVEIDPAKINAIQKFPVPENVSKLRSFLGIVNFVAKFVPELSDTLAPLHNLLKKDVQWSWSESQNKAFLKIKDLICKFTSLNVFDPKKPITIQNDSSEYAIGSVLLQDDRPVAYASRSLTPTEKNYAQIEKEFLAIIFGLEKFHNYVYGNNNVTVITDHKPLTFIVQKPISKAPKRIQNMILRIQDYNFKLI